LKGGSNYYDTVAVFTEDSICHSKLILNSNTTQKQRDFRVPRVVQLQFITPDTIIIKVDSSDNYYRLCALTFRGQHQIQEIDKIPKLDPQTHQKYEHYITNRKLTTLMYFAESPTNRDILIIKLLALNAGPTFLTTYETQIQIPRATMKDMFFGFSVGSDLVEFNKISKVGNLHKINLWMVTHSTHLKAPASWDSSNIMHMEIASGHTVTLMYSEDEGRRSLTLADIRKIGNNMMFTSLHARMYNADEEIQEIKIKQIGKYFNYLVAVKLRDKLEVISYIMTQVKLTDQRIFFNVPGDKYDLLFIKGFYFILFRDGSLSHINHTFFQGFKLKI
jgi:hypothetical protein